MLLSACLCRTWGMWTVSSHNISKSWVLGDNFLYKFWRSRALIWHLVIKCSSSSISKHQEHSLWFGSVLGLLTTRVQFPGHENWLYFLYWNSILAYWFNRYSIQCWTYFCAVYTISVKVFGKVQYANFPRIVPCTVNKIVLWTQHKHSYRYHKFERDYTPLWPMSWIPRAKPWP